ncbi:hypothetical protein NVP1177O_22 [Vibrio phage 1.177.O._10N.286.45.E10]|nr:hypothetical protein NVP1177O_22 [Vibrio phage 1.177.O._10N.286.45.E10]
MGMMRVENSYDFTDIHKRNRHQAKDKKSHTKHWCDYCDAKMVSNGEKCGNCGKKA